MVSQSLCTSSNLSSIPYIYHPGVEKLPSFIAIDNLTPVGEQVYQNAHLKPGSQPANQECESLSLYLCSCCALCFGGSHTKGKDVQAIVCCDANFQLERIWDRDHRKGMDGKEGAQDPLLTSPQTVILPKDFVKEWKHHIESLCPPRAQAGQKRSRQHEDIELEVRDVNTLDQQEAGLPLSNSTYNACQDSFIAANREHIKASMNYFVDTGVMAMLCQHNLPLFIANVQTV